jgi:eukaryotic-like serine/threonine-protein kinase
MSPERWQRIEQLYNAALERTPEERVAFLAQASADDDVLRSEVEGLLAANEQSGRFLATPALEQEAKNLAAENNGAPATLHVGQELSHYRILSRIGAGGMGEVFLARDTILERRVALKLLPVQFTRKTERLQRFVREAKAASALNHPNIITIYEIGEVDTAVGKTQFIATEFIEGETLRSWTTDPENRLRQTLNIAVQIASALDAAHIAGIIHRDIKPENVMLRPDGLVKVLDFGLAKLTTPPNIGDTKAQTLMEGMKTRPGIILGTLRYMSPEQARGRSVDARSDIFSLGVLLYEMLTGLQLFPGENDADVVAAIIRKEAPPLAEQVSDVAAEIERIVQKTLNKNANERYQTAGDLRIDLRNLQKRLEFETDTSGKVLTPSGGLDARTSSRINLSTIAKRPLVIIPAVLGTLALALIAVFMSQGSLVPYRRSADARYWYDLGTSALRDGTYYKASKGWKRQ